MVPVELALELGCGRAAEVVVDPPGADHADVAECPGGDDFATFEVEVVGAALHADLDDLFGVFFRLHEFDTLLRRLAEGLFDVDILAGGERVEDHSVMPMLGRGDEDGLDFLVVEELLVVPIGFGSFGFGEGGFEMGFIDVADGGDLDGGVLLEDSHDEGAAAAGADDAEVEAGGLGEKGCGCAHKEESPSDHESRIL